MYGHPVPRRIGLQDVAEAAEVSLTTASHALNGKGRVPESTRQRVRAAADRLGYRPSRTARGLATGQTYTLAVQISGGGERDIIPESSYFVGLLNGAAAEASRHGYSLLLAPPAASADALPRLQVDGGIVVDPVGRETGLSSLSVPVVATGRAPRAAGATAWVDNDHGGATRTALDHLAEAGYHRPALVVGAGRQSYLRDITRSYRAWCRERQIDPVVASVAGGVVEEPAARAAERLLRAHPEVDALFASLDRLAVGCLQAAYALSRPVGPGLGIVALTDSPLLTAVRPQITAIDLNADEIGRRAVRLLVGLLTGTADPTAHELVDTTLRRRDSTRRGTTVTQRSPTPVRAR
jgi:DNA-binding LacI/PurR family transcriptional regulator